MPSLHSLLGYGSSALLSPLLPGPPLLVHVDGRRPGLHPHVRDDSVGRVVQDEEDLADVVALHVGVVDWGTLVQVSF